MQPSATFTLASLTRWWEPFSDFQSRLVRDGKPLPVIVKGVAIGMQLCWDGLTVLATEYDWLDGCQSWLYALDRSGRPVDQLTLPEQLGGVQEVVIEGDHCATFGCYGSPDRWRLQLSVRPVWSFAWSDLRWRRNRFLLARRWLQLAPARGSSWSPPSGPQ